MKGWAGTLVRNVDPWKYVVQSVPGPEGDPPAHPEAALKPDPDPLIPNPDLNLDPEPRPLTLNLTASSRWDPPCPPPHHCYWRMQVIQNRCDPDAGGPRSCRCQGRMDDGPAGPSELLWVEKTLFGRFSCAKLV